MLFLKKILLNREDAFYCVCLNFDRFGSFVRDSNIVKKLLSLNLLQRNRILLKRSLKVSVLPTLQLFEKSNPMCALCSRNFQNVKLRLDFVEMDYFATNQILREIKFWRFQTVQKCHFWQF